jgi:hypothetical protein
VAILTPSGCALFRASPLLARPVIAVPDQMWLRIGRLRLVGRCTKTPENCVLTHVKRMD